MPMLCPSIPIDKNKKGGRNYDSSKLTDFKKICLISNDDTTKPNQQTDRIELRRGAILASSLLTIPGFVVSSQINYASQIVPSGVIGSLTGMTFYVWYTNAAAFKYQNNKIYKSSASPFVYNTVATNTDAELYSEAGTVDSITVAAGSTLQTVIDRLNEKLSWTTEDPPVLLHSWDSGTSKLLASLTPEGKLKVTISGAQLPATGNAIVGIFFGNASNGSTALGVTLESEELENKNGVGGAALMIVAGQTSVTAPYKIGGVV